MLVFYLPDGRAIPVDHCTPYCAPSPTDLVTLSAQVGRGAALLDRERPGWAAEIDTDRLNLASSTFCIAGQLYGDFAEGMRLLRLGQRPLIEDWTPDHPIVQHGFVLDHALYTATMGGGYRYLQDAWIAAIADRRVSDVAPAPSADAAALVLA